MPAIAVIRIKLIFKIIKLKILNLSSCCKQIPKECQQLFRPLYNLQVLDLSGSDMYKSCLDTPGKLSFCFSKFRIKLSEI